MNNRNYALFFAAAYSLASLHGAPIPDNDPAANQNSHSNNSVQQYYDSPCGNERTTYQYVSEMTVRHIQQQDQSERKDLPQKDTKKE